MGYPRCARRQSECGTTISRPAHAGASRAHVRKPKCRDCLQSMRQRSQAACAQWALPLMLASQRIGRTGGGASRCRWHVGRAKLRYSAASARPRGVPCYSGDAPAGAKQTARRVGYRRAARARRLLRRTLHRPPQEWQSWCRLGFHPTKPRPSSCRSSARLLIDLLRQVRQALRVLCVCVRVCM